MKFFSKHIKWVSIFILVVVVASSIVIAVNVLNPTEVESCRDQGCSWTFWKHNPQSWAGHDPSYTLLRTLFSQADIYHVGGVTLMNALSSNWGICDTTPAGIAARALLKEGIAAKLNVSNPAIDYHVSGTTVTTMVNDALASGSVTAMDYTMNMLSTWNNAGCPLIP